MSAARFDVPVTTEPATRVVVELGIDLKEFAPLPVLVEPDRFTDVTNPVHEPLVAVEHRRIRTLSNYWHAGWSKAQPATLLRKGAMERLAAVADDLPDRFGLAIFDAWRPLDLQAELFK